jgi:ABC-type transporter Mla MlaB component
MEKVYITNTLTENQNKQTSIEGDLIIRYSIKIKEELLTLLRDHHNNELPLKNIERIDVAVLQSLVALSKSASKEGMVVKYSFE